MTDAVVEECQRLKAGQLDLQVQVFIRIVASVLEVIAQYRVAPATRLVCILEWCDRPIRDDPHEAMVGMASDRRALLPPTRLHHSEPLAGVGQREGQPSPAFCLPIHLRVRAVDQPDHGRVR